MQFMPNPIVFVGAVALSMTGAAHADIIDVPGDQPTIQAGINAASNGDEVVIAPGTYSGCNNFNGKAITMRSTDPDDPDIVAATVLTGCGSPVTGAVEFDSDEGPASILRGLTIAATGESTGVLFFGASPTIDRCVFTGHNGASNRAMQVTGSPTITQCTFIDNHPHGGQIGCNIGGGGAIAVCGVDGGDGPVISDCTFTNNSVTSEGGGAIIAITGPVTITGCTFTGNSTTSGSGGGAIRASSSVAISDCTFVDNQAPIGGAISGSAPIEGCHFTGNQATSAGGAVRIGGGGTIDNCTFTMNSAPDGGAISLAGSAVITNCIIEENTATGNGGGVWAGIGSGTVSNSLIKMNDAGGEGGGMYVGVDAMPTIVDSVFCHNTPDNLEMDGLTTINGQVLATDEPECVPMIAEFGACCMPSGACVVTTNTSCTASGGIYQGDGADCDRSDCTPPPTCLADIVTSATFQPPPDGIVDGADLAYLLGAWGTCE